MQSKTKIIGKIAKGFWIISSVIFYYYAVDKKFHQFSINLSNEM